MIWVIPILGVMGVRSKRQISTGLQVMDNLPTCMELAGAAYPEMVNGLKTSQIEGKSLLPLLQKKVQTNHDKVKQMNRLWESWYKRVTDLKQS